MRSTKEVTRTSKQIWFRSDDHFGHARIIQYANRPFKDVDEMDAAMIERHNELVKPQDKVYFLGDFAFYKKPETIRAILSRMNGVKTMVLGNHDDSVLFFNLRRENPLLLDAVHFRIVEEYFDGRSAPPWTLSHFPQLSWNRSHHGAFNLFGHHHNNLPFDPKRRQMDIGVDTNDFRPWHYDEIVTKLEKVPMPTFLEDRKHVGVD